MPYWYLGSLEVGLRKPHPPAPSLSPKKLFHKILLPALSLFVYIDQERWIRLCDNDLFLYSMFLLFFLNKKKKQKKSRLAQSLRVPSRAHAQQPVITGHTGVPYQLPFGVLLPNTQRPL